MMMGSQACCYDSCAGADDDLGHDGDISLVRLTSPVRDEEEANVTNSIRRADPLK